MATLAVIGAGPKAAALAACVSARARAGGRPHRLTIFEKQAVGAAWSGNHGYSDGEQLLCTPAARDVGYPYRGRLEDQICLQRFSWWAYLNHTGMVSDWVDRNRHYPTHGEFARYLDFVIRMADPAVTVVSGEAVTLESADGSALWTVETGDGRRHGGFDGVVVTGSGTPLAPLRGAVPTVVMNGVDYWRRRSRVRALLAAPQSHEDPVVIVGAGGTAAAVALRLATDHPDRPIVVIGRQPTLFARTDSYFENRLFSDPDGSWETLTTEQKQEVGTRLGAGVLWARVAERLAALPRLEYVCGSALRFRRQGPPYRRELFLEYRTEGGERSIGAPLFVDCRGFDATWFRDMIGGPTGAGLRAALNADNARTELMRAVDRAFRLTARGAPDNLHVPAIGGLVHPAAANLMALGDVARAILDGYED